MTEAREAARRIVDTIEGGKGVHFKLDDAVTVARALLAIEPTQEARDLKKLLAHLWLHVTSDEDFSADEIKLDIEKAIAGEIDELRHYPDLVTALSELCGDIDSFFGGKYGSPAYLRAKELLSRTRGAP